MPPDPGSFLPKTGDYRELLSYRKSEVIYDFTFRFCERFLKRGDRTIDQMVQAARSGKQNIAEGNKASVTSTETELKLTNVARASLEELLIDYQDLLRMRNLTLWTKDFVAKGGLRERMTRVKLDKLESPWQNRHLNPVRCVSCNNSPDFRPHALTESFELAVSALLDPRNLNITSNGRISTQKSPKLQHKFFQTVTLAQRRLGLSERIPTLS